MYAAGTEVVVVERTTVRDPYGDITVTENNATYPGCAVWPRGASTEVNARDRTSVVTGLLVILPADASVGPDDRLVIDGTMYEVEGEAGVWVNPYNGHRSGIQVAARRSSG